MKESVEDGAPHPSPLPGGEREPEVTAWRVNIKVTFVLEA
jgi:hypothetical protein